MTDTNHPHHKSITHREGFVGYVDEYGKETKFNLDLSDWATCPECGGDEVDFVLRETPGSRGTSGMAYIYCDDCGRFRGVGNKQETRGGR